ncbi:MAG: L,D-transpeptidase family protein [Hyphomicrobiales bacterium]|nr:L,D-transpeptidase family protein [Hyphomicrobiales bacterium]
MLSTRDGGTLLGVLRAAVVACALVATQSAGAQDISSIDNWLKFDSREGGAGWDQPFDRSFVQQWESQPQRGFPTLSRDNVGPMKAAIKRYADIVANGGWERLPNIELRVGSSEPAVAVLRRRLEAEGDLRPVGGDRQTFDYYVEKAVKRAQERHGIAPTGFVDKNTIAALNIPASAKLRQLRANLIRISSMSSATATGKYVVVNIPAAQIEAVQNNQVVSRHSGVVGKVDRQTPILQSSIHELNFNKEWIVPPTVLREDLVPKGRDLSGKGKNVLEQYGIDAYADYAAFRRGQKIDPRTIDFDSPRAMNLFYVQNPGEENPLGFVKINFHNSHAVYMHDTPAKSIFARNFRAESSGCVRVQNIPQLAAWLLEEQGWTVQQVLRMKQSGQRLDVALKKRVPLYFTYITAWATPDNMVHFRRDFYRRDGVGLTASAY